MADLNINFQFAANAQSLKAGPREIQEMGEDFARLVVDEVALAASDSSFKRAKRSFIAGIRKTVEGEVSRMAMLIGRFLPLPDKYTGPNGQMSVGEMSATARQTPGFQPTFNRKDANIQWQKRSQKYLTWKRRHDLPARWWKASGDLQNYLSSKGSEFYEDVFGPIRVRFERRVVRNAQGRFAKQGITTLAVNPGDIEGGARKTVNVTHPGSRGNISAEYQVGQIQVDVFGKITPQMLPALAGKTWNPRQSDPYPGEGVVGLFPDDGPGGIRNKLLGTRKGPHHRYAIEPFVGFYLTRAIPNAVWRRTEQIVRGV